MPSPHGHTELRGNAFKRGKEFVKNGDWTQAIRAFTEAIDFPAGNAAVHSTEFKAFNESDHERNFDSHIEGRLVSCDARYNRGIAYFNNHQHEEAIRDFEAVIKEKGTIEGSFSGVDKKRYTLNKKKADWTDKLTPLDIGAHLYRALAYKCRNQMELARADCEKVQEFVKANGSHQLRIDPNALRLWEDLCARIQQPTARITLEIRFGKTLADSSCVQVKTA